MTDPQRFTAKIWRVHGLDEGYAFLSHKDWDNGSWRDYPGPYVGDGLWPDEVDELEERDIYFAPLLFAKPHRQRDHALPSRWLYADLDEVEPNSISKELTPTLAWETSPGRFQALWLLDRSLDLEKFESLNRRLTYAVGADRGGWSATKVLRVPGTVSTKYGRSRAKRHAVELVGPRGRMHHVENLHALLPRAERAGKVGGVFRGIDVAGLPNRKEVLKEWRMRLPGRARKLIGTRHAVVGDDRSARLWELYNLLLQAGMSPEEVLVVTQGTVWNKYSGQRRELIQLQREIGKAAEKHAQPDELERLVRARGKKKVRGAAARKLEKRKKEKPDKLEFLTYEEFMAHEFPKPDWLVEGFWVKGAYGVCAGMYKSFKTMTLLNMALSVASGTPFLEDDRFAVKEQGKVLYLHEEGRQGGIQDRMHRIAHKKGMSATFDNGILHMPPKIPIHVASFTGFKLSEQQSQRKLVNYLAEEQPLLVVMESWYLIASEINENNANEVAPVLDWLGKVGKDFGCAVVVSHHYNKGNDDPSSHKRAADRMSGSGVFGRWYESAIFLERKGEEDEYMAAISAEHRELKGVPKQTMQIEMDVEDEDAYEVLFVDDNTDRQRNGKSPASILRRLVASGRPVPTGRAVSALRAEGINMDYRKVLSTAAELGIGNKQMRDPTGGKPVWVLVREPIEEIVDDA